MIEQTNTITESIKLKSGQVWDGKGQTYHLKAGWDFCPFLVENVQDVVLKNFNLIVTQPDKLKKVSGLEKSVANLALASKNKPADKKQPPKADPNKVYDIAIGNSVVLGKKDASVTIIEWTDFQ